MIRHELRGLFHAPSTYIAMVLSLLLMGFFYYLTLLTVQAEEQEQMPATLYFSLFWVPVLLIVPMLTMRSFAEERRIGTIETLLTAPILPVHLVLAKFLAAYLFYLLVWGISLAYPLITALVVDQPEVAQRLFDPGSLIGGLLFIAASGTLFISIGVFTSSLTRSQLVAGMLSFSILFMLIVGIAAIQLIDLDLGASARLSDAVLTYFQVFDHFEDFSRGLVDTRPFVYYLSSSAAVLGIAVLIVESKR
jgi:ABC-2 type transport system permease protein